MGTDLTLGKGIFRLRTGFGMLWKVKMPFSRTWEYLEKRVFFKWLWKSFGFLFVKALKRSLHGCSLVLYQTPYKLCVCSFYYL